MVRVLASVLDENPEKTARGVIFDGFPRTIPQAEALKKMLEERGTSLDAVVGLEVPEEELVERMIKRGKDTGRADDNLETIKNRLDVYHKQTQPLREHYINQGSYHAIDGSGDTERIFADIKNKLDNLKK